MHNCWEGSHIVDHILSTSKPDSEKCCNSNPFPNNH